MPARVWVGRVGSPLRGGRRAIEAGTGEVVVPGSVFAAYAGRPLAGKLGIKAGSRVSLAGAPDEFAAALGELPPGAALVAGPDESARRAGLTIWFVRSAEELSTNLHSIVDASRRRPTWIAWPKKGSFYAGDLTQQAVREAGAESGLGGLLDLLHRWGLVSLAVQMAREREEATHPGLD